MKKTTKTAVILVIPREELIEIIREKNNDIPDDAWVDITYGSTADEKNEEVKSINFHWTIEEEEQ